jgi:hypothetical protein
MARRRARKAGYRMSGATFELNFFTETMVSATLAIAGHNDGEVLQATIGSHPTVRQ